MNAPYYLWKWADNDLPGQPNEVFSELLRGRMHPAIQAFNPTPVVARLERMAALGRPRGEEWDWQIHQAPPGQQASFIFLTCPTVRRYGEMRRRFCESLLNLDIAGYDEQRGQLSHYALPKMNCWEAGDSDENAYDIAEDDLPVLLRRMHPDSPVSYAILNNRQNHFVQCSIFKRRFTIEWRVNYDLADFSKFDQWRVGYFKSPSGGPRLFLPKEYESERVNAKCVLVPLEPRKHKEELILYRDTLRIFRAFLRGEPRPPQYHWLDIKDELP